MARDPGRHTLQVCGGALPRGSAREDDVAQAAAAVGVRHHAVHEHMPQMIGRTEPPEPRESWKRPDPRAELGRLIQVRYREVHLDLHGIGSEARRQVRRAPPPRAQRAIAALIQQAAEQPRLFPRDENVQIVNAHRLGAGQGRDSSLEDDGLEMVHGCELLDLAQLALNREHTLQFGRRPCFQHPRRTGGQGRRRFEGEPGAQRQGAPLCSEKQVPRGRRIARDAVPRCRSRVRVSCDQEIQRPSTERKGMLDRDARGRGESSQDV